MPEEPPFQEAAVLLEVTVLLGLQPQHVSQLCHAQLPVTVCVRLGEQLAGPRKCPLLQSNNRETQISPLQAMCWVLHSTAHAAVSRLLAGTDCKRLEEGGGGGYCLLSGHVHVQFV